MKRTCVGMWALCAVVAVGCGGRDRDEREPAGTAASGDARPAPITATGCLTAQGDRFVLTDLERTADGGTTAAGQAATETYQLIGEDDQLRPHVGQQVRVNGEAEPPAVAEMRESTPASPASPASGATGTAGQAQSPQPQQNPENAQQGAAAPQVRTETETRMEVARLRVQSVTPTGSSCAAETKGEGDPASRPRQ